MSERDDAVTLDCEECGLKTIFPHENLTDQTLLICRHCGADHGTWLSVKEQLHPLIEDFAADMAGEKFDGQPGFTRD